VVQLTQDIVNGTTTCLNIIDVYDVDFDCNGYEMKSNYIGSDESFIYSINWSYSTMSNCELVLDGVSSDDFMQLRSASNSVFENFIVNISGQISGEVFNTILLTPNITIRDWIVNYDNNLTGRKVFAITNPYNMTIQNISIYSTGNGQGMYIFDVENGVGYEAIVTDSIFQNLEIGAYIYESGGETVLFYNNIFNSTDNYYENQALVTDFNTTLTIGTNIVGGPYIGGNWWEGFSNNCTDANTDGICDEVYTDSGDTDYFPLTFTPDISPPNITINDPQNDTYDTTAIPINITTEDLDSGIDTCLYSNDGGSNSTYSPPTTIKITGEGQHYIEYYCNDTAGNLAYDSVWFTYIAPTPAPIDSIPAPFGGVAAVAVAAGFILLMLGVYLESGMDINFFITGTIGLIIVIALIGYLLTGS